MEEEYDAHIYLYPNGNTPLIVSWTTWIEDTQIADMMITGFIEFKDDAGTLIQLNPRYIIQVNKVKKTPVASRGLSFTDRDTD